MHKMENAQLNSRLKEGLPPAYEELFKQTFPRMLGYCRLFIKDQDVANDIVQECFVKLWEKKDTIKISQSIESFLFVMLRNRCLNYLRDKKMLIVEKDIQSIQENELQHLFQLDFLGNEETTLEEQLIIAIRESVEKLPEKRRIIFTKAKLEGKRHKEIAEELNISVKAVEKHLHLAKEQIRKEMLEKFPLLAIIITMIIK